jgi:ABC-type lipoprotein release transport system permease subunit
LITCSGAWAVSFNGVQPHDTATFAVTTLTLGLIAGLACVVPALKAALVDSATALRAE